MNYGLLGESLSHSFSKEIHESFNLYKFNYFEVKKDKLDEFMTKREFSGIMVTNPYKKEVMKYLYKIDEKAKKIGAVNTIINRNGRLYGYNTDYDGVLYTFQKMNIEIKNKKVLILGRGATSQTIKTALEDLEAKEITRLSRREYPFINQYEKYLDREILINATPVGMYPDNLKSLVNLEKFYNLEFVFDVVYNPLKTKLILDADRLKIKNESGLDMLVSQAKVAAEHFMNLKISDRILGKTINKIYKKKANIVLIGMPGAGKSSVGRKISEITKREHIDLDLEFVKKYGNIEKFFKEEGEKAFRKLEKDLVKRFGKKSGIVISTGGGVVVDRNNYYPLKQNGIIFYVKRDIEKLEKEDRPLSKEVDLNELFESRKNLYENFSDFSLENNKTIDISVKEVLNKFYENIGD